MRTTLLLGLGIVVGVGTASCDHWRDGASSRGGEPGDWGMAARSDPAGPSPTSRLPHERDSLDEDQTRLRAGESRGLHDGPAVPPGAGTGPTLDVEDAASAPLGTTGSGATGTGTTTGGTTTTTGGAS